MNANLLLLVSVVIPCYNSARYLAETIESVRLQTYPRIEIIVVDDGSTDETAKIARSRGVRYIHQANRGISAARNTGILHSQGQYVLFLDHDDRLLPRAVKTGVELLEEHTNCTLSRGRAQVYRTGRSSDWIFQQVCRGAGPLSDAPGK